MTATPIETPVPGQAAEDEIPIEQRLDRAQRLIESFRVSLREAAEETVIIRADLSACQAEIQALNSILTQVNAENLRLRSTYEPDQVLGAAQPHDHGDGEHTH